MKNNRKTKALSSLAVLGIAFLVIACLFGVIIHSGANHPPMRFPNISQITTRFVDELAQEMNRNVSLSLSSQGPFKWDNSKDLGFSKILGEWANELNQETVIYYRRDKDATWQERAQKVLSAVDVITSELSAQIGQIVCSADSANGRRIPVYMPETGQEFAEVLAELCDGMRMPTSGDGCSVIDIGPLGCQNKGIVLHPDMFAADADCEYVLRKELARYTMLSSFDYNEDLSMPAWFTEGFVDYFAQASDTLTVISQDLTDWAEREFSLSVDALTRGSASIAQAGASFFQFLAEEKGADTVGKLIQAAFSESLEEAFAMSEIDFEQMKTSWILTLREGFSGI